MFMGSTLPAVGLFFGGGQQGNGVRIRFAKGNVRRQECFYLRDCNNNHTSATGLVASIIISTVEQKCMGVKTILVSVCVCGCLCVFLCV